ncbi:PREDICTED: MFS-type transporter SLC18B1 [Elephantulus edwardii]|uniref:MFS-type transporter SLC18B1 n=1 Tax=Elephantulus edwardii TaxID=28737 RepID=UPI0003F0B1E9|nr:PREDICTED: MFS-type transporter SLC18B1 [Elephantulus edwardii]
MQARTRLSTAIGLSSCPPGFSCRSSSRAPGPRSGGARVHAAPWTRRGIPRVRVPLEVSAAGTPGAPGGGRPASSWKLAACLPRLQPALPLTLFPNSGALNVCLRPESVPSGDDPMGTAGEAPRWLSREQLFTLISAASINLCSSMYYSILGPFFSKEAEKKGASNTIIGMIFGCYAVFDLLASLVFGKYLVHIGAKFMFVAGMFVSGGVTILFGVLDQLPDGPIFIAMCFLVRVADAVSFAAAITASFSILAKAFPNNVATVLGSLEIFSGLGLVLGPPLGGFLYQSFGYEVPFIFLGSIVLLMVPLNMCILPNYETDPGTHSFWKLITLPRVALLAFVINSLSAGFGFLDPTLSLFVLDKFNLPAGYVGLVFLGLALSYTISSPLFGLLSDKMPHLRKWLLVFGNITTAGCYMLLGPVPFLHVKSQLWLLVLVLVIVGVSSGMSIIPTFPEILSCAYENGFEEGLSTLGLVSGLFGAMWSVG